MKNKTINVVLAILLSFFALGFTIKFTLNFTPLYAFDVSYLNLDKELGMDKVTLVKNYKAVTDYIEKSSIKKLSMPDFKMSKQGEIHFEEVKAIFNKIDFMFYFSIILFALIFITSKKNKKIDYKFLNISSILIIMLPALLLIPFAVDFNKSFVIFHKMFFNNDYWLFDPSTDPIINALPEAYFFHCALLILSLLCLEFIILRITKKVARKQFKIEN